MKLGSSVFYLIMGHKFIGLKIQFYRSKGGSYES
jgi:hypothetical protein